MKCDNCGKELDEKWNLCPFCGTKVSNFVDSNSNNENGIFKDPRDGQVYKTCKIGNQIWLAENLKYETRSGCHVYDDDYQYLDKYGYIYEPGAFPEAIPEGWHLPTKDELITLEKNVLKDHHCKYAGPHLISKEWFSMLKMDPSKIDKPAQFSKEWLNGKKIDLYSRFNSEDSIDSYGFSALPGGYRKGKSSTSYGYFEGLDQITYWWFAPITNANYDRVWRISFSSSPAILIGNHTYKIEGYVRLIKD